MTNMVQQTEDHTIVVRVGDKNYVDSEANFALDFAEPAPVLPAGADDRTYEQGVRHAITDCQTILEGGPMPWTDGDRYITNIDMGLANQEARRAAVTPVPPPTP